MRTFSKLYLVSLALQWASVLAAPALQDRTAQIEWVVGQPVQTSSGLLIGQPAKGAPNVSEYLGIPYARPPIGNLRFTAPKKYEGTGNITARFFVGPPCAIEFAFD
jgi:cholinesterase